MAEFIEKYLLFNKRLKDSPATPILQIFVYSEYMRDTTMNFYSCANWFGHSFRLIIKTIWKVF